MILSVRLNCSGAVFLRERWIVGWLDGRRSSYLNDEDGGDGFKDIIANIPLLQTVKRQVLFLEQKRGGQR